MKIAILGFARSFTDAPFADAGVEIWGMNELYQHLPRWDRWFELHDAEYLGRTARVETPDEPERHLNWLKAQDGTRPIYMLRQHPDIPASVAYPIDAMVDRFGRYFTSTVGYMLGLAIARILDARAHPSVPEPGEWIGLFGIDLASDNEYAAQRPNAEYLIGYARGCGIPVYVPDTAAVTHAAGLYGYEPAPEHQGLVTEWFLTKHRAEYQEKCNAELARMNTLDGVIQAYAFLYTMRERPELATREQLIEFIREQHRVKTEEHGQAMANANTLMGVVQAATFYLQVCAYKKRGVYLPETDPFAAAPAASCGA